MTLRLLEKEVLELPPRSRVRLAEKIMESIDDYATPELEAAWDDEIERRVKEIQSGAECHIDRSTRQSERTSGERSTRYGDSLQQNRAVGMGRGPVRG